MKTSKYNQIEAHYLAKTFGKTFPWFIIQRGMGYFKSILIILSEMKTGKNIYGFLMNILIINHYFEFSQSREREDIEIATLATGGGAV